MTASTTIPTRTGVKSSLRRIANLARWETTLLMRDKLVVFNAICSAPGMVLVLLSTGAEFTMATITSMMLNMALLMVVYYNLTTIFVSRREEHVFKRYATGEVTEWEGMTGAAVPSIAIMLIQTILAAILGGVVFGPPHFTNLVLVVAAIVLGAVTFTGLAAASTAFTKTVESAQLATMPVLLVLLFSSGIMFPLHLFSEQARSWFNLNPLYATSMLVELGFSEASLSIAIRPLASMIVWALIAVTLARRYMRFEPRR